MKKIEEALECEMKKPRGNDSNFEDTGMKSINGMKRNPESANRLNLQDESPETLTKHWKRNGWIEIGKALENTAQLAPSRDPSRTCRSVFIKFCCRLG